jgi:hypothetical protein
MYFLFASKSFPREGRVVIRVGFRSISGIRANFYLDLACSRCALSNLLRQKIVYQNLFTEWVNFWGGWGEGGQERGYFLRGGGGWIGSRFSYLGTYPLPPFPPILNVVWFKKTNKHHEGPAGTSWLNLLPHQ